MKPVRRELTEELEVTDPKISETDSLPRRSSRLGCMLGVVAAVIAVAALLLVVVIGMFGGAAALALNLPTAAAPEATQAAQTEMPQATPESRPLVIGAVGSDEAADGTPTAVSPALESVAGEVAATDGTADAMELPQTSGDVAEGEALSTGQPAGGDPDASELMEAGSTSPDGHDAMSTDEAAATPPVAEEPAPPVAEEPAPPAEPSPAPTEQTEGDRSRPVVVNRAGRPGMDGGAAVSAIQRTKGNVTVVGGAVVELVKGRRRVKVPGPVPAGKYQIEAKFPGFPQLKRFGEVTVKANKDVVIKCDVDLKICR